MQISYFEFNFYFYMCPRHQRQGTETEQHSCVLSNISNAQSSVMFEVFGFIPVFMKYTFLAQDITQGLKNILKSSISNIIAEVKNTQRNDARRATNAKNMQLLEMALTSSSKGAHLCDIQGLTYSKGPLAFILSQKIQC